MKLREIIKNQTVLEDVSVFAMTTKDYDGSAPNILIGIYKAGEAARSLYHLELTREATLKLIQQLSAAYAEQPYTPEEIAHHEAVVADRKAEGAYL